MHSIFALEQGLLNLDWMRQTLGNVPANQTHTQVRNNSDGTWKAGWLFIGSLTLALVREEEVRPSNSTLSSVPVLTAGNGACPKPMEPVSIFGSLLHPSFSSSSLCSSPVTDLPGFHVHGRARGRGGCCQP